MKAYAAALCAVMIAGTALAVPAAQAQTKKQYVYTTTRGLGQAAPARVTVAPRSFLVPGPRVRPATDLPTTPSRQAAMAGSGSITVINTGSKIGWIARR